MANGNVKAVSFEGAVKTPEGLSFKGVIMQPVIDKCEGCARIVAFEDQNYCHSYPQPARKWALGVCNFATHAKTQTGTQGKSKVNPLKASKRSVKGR